MDIRVVESIPTSGTLKDPLYRIDPNFENVSLVWSEDEETLTLVDYNLDYNLLSFQNNNRYVKKTFLTYNGKSCESHEMMETVLIESSNEKDGNAVPIPGYCNSNEWIYTPRDFNYNWDFKEFTNIKDYSNKPYDYSQGFTVVKQFLTSGANITPGGPAYTAFYRAPHLTSFLPANVENNRIYTDGWYTSYVIACQVWLNSGNPPAYGKGDIVYHDQQQRFYKNLTGNQGYLITDPAFPNAVPEIKKPNPEDWSPDVTFEDWMTLLRKYSIMSTTGSAIKFVETQHLVTAELNKAILSELKCQCNCCDKPDFNMSYMLSYMKLMQKRLGAYVLFNDEIFHEAQCVVESSRRICDLCLYTKKEGGCC
jgi:hypothetical protein